MTETAQATSNPFDPAGHKHGGGLWDGKTVTITGSKAELALLTYGDGTPVIDDKTKQQSQQVCWRITGIADDEDKERFEQYSVGGGGKIVPEAGGEGFRMADGSPLQFHANSNISKMTAGLKEGGFDMGVLYAGGKQKLSALVGARFVFKAVPKVGRDGKVTKDKKGYDKNAYFPVKFVGWAAGRTASAGAGNGAATAPVNGLDKKAADAVIGVLAGGPVSRADLVRALSVALAADSDRNAILGLVVRDDWHKGKAWKYDGTTASL